MPNFGDLFRTINNNNKESILAMQWIYNAGVGGSNYDYGNSIQASWAFSSTITGGTDGYGVFGPTIDLQNAYVAEGGDTIRRHFTIMLPGSYYSEIDVKNGGYTLPLTASSQGTQSEPKKYVVGAASDPDNNGKINSQSAGNNTYIMRYAMFSLIEAEAIMGQEVNPAVGTGIPLTALYQQCYRVKYFNMVRKQG